MRRIRKFHHSGEDTILISPQADATRKRILAPGSIGSFAEHLLDQLTPRSESELDAIFSELTTEIFSKFAVLLSWPFALSEGQGKSGKCRANIDTDRTAAYLAEYRPDASKLIVLKC